MAMIDGDVAVTVMPSHTHCPRNARLALVIAVALATPLAVTDARAQRSVDIASLEVEGKLLRVQPKGARCKFEFKITKASINDGPVSARLVLEQACTKDSPKVGSAVKGSVGASRVRKSVRTNKDGIEVLEFSARIHGAFSEGTLAPLATAKPNGRLIGDATLGPSPKPK